MGLLTRQPSTIVPISAPFYDLTTVAFVGTNPLVNYARPIPSVPRIFTPTGTLERQQDFGLTGTKFVSDTDKLVFGSSEFSVPSTNKVSFFVVFAKTDTTNRAIRVFAPASGPVYEAAAHIPYSDGTLYWDFGGNAGANRVSAAGINWVGVQSILLSAGPSGMRIVRNGRLLASSTTAVTKLLSNADLMWGDYSTLVADRTNLFLFAALNCDLPLSAALSLTANPWSFFSNPSNVWQFGFAPAAGGTIVEASASGNVVAIGSATHASTRLTAVSGSVNARGSDTATTARTVALAGAATVRGTTSATVVTAGVVTSEATGRVATRGTSAATTTRTAAVAGAAGLRGACAASGIRTGLAAGRVAARGVVEAAAVLPGVTLASAAGHALVRGSVTSTQIRVADADCRLTARGAATYSSMRSGLADGRMLARGSSISETEEPSIDTSAKPSSKRIDNTIMRIGSSRIDRGSTRIG